METELFKLKLEMDKINTHLCYLFLKLKDEFNCDSIEEAKNRITQLKKEIKNLKQLNK